MNKMLILLLFLGMNNSSLESLLEKNINNFPDAIEIEDSREEGFRTFVSKSQNALKFGDKSFNQLLLVVDLNNEVVRIDTVFYEVFDIITLQELVKTYGIATRIYKDGNLEEVYKEKDEGAFVTSREYRGKTIECELNDSPTLVYWEKSDFTISLRIAEQNNKTWLTIDKK